MYSYVVLIVIVNYKAIVSFNTPVSNDTSSSSDNITIIGGAVGGVILLLMITVVLCIVIVCMRRSHMKKGSTVDGNATKLNTNVTIDNNPSYDVTEANTLDHSYSTIKPRGSDVPITSNPSYIVPYTKPYSKTSEDDYNYVQPNEFVQHSELEDNIKMQTNPSYGVSVQEERAAATGSDTAHQSSHDATTEQYDYACVQDDHLLHHNTSANTTGDAKEILY